MWSDQMPVAIQLNNSDTIALALETRLDRENHLKISLSYSNDNWAKSLEPLTETGPADKLSQVFNGIGPYIRQFPSGEVVISYTNGMPTEVVFADGTAKNFGKSFTVFNDLSRTYWHATEILSSHSILAVTEELYKMANTGSKFYNITYVPLVLNHRINAPTTTPKIDGQSDDWDNNTDALFIGSESQAQASVRAAHDSDNIYFLSERLDEYLSETGDTLTIYLSDSRIGDEFYRVTLDYKGVVSFDKYGDIGGIKGFSAVDGAVSAVAVKGELNKKGDEMNGIVNELSIPKNVILSDEKASLFITLSLANTDNGKKSSIDSLAGIAIDDKSNWIEIELN
jgi:hypothetical protein